MSAKFHVEFPDWADASLWVAIAEAKGLVCYFDNPEYRYAHERQVVEWTIDLNARAERSVVELIHDTRNQLGAEAVFAGFADDTAVGFKVLASVSQEPFANKVKRSRLMSALAHIYGMVLQVGRDLTAIEEGGAAPAVEELPLRERN